MVKKASGITLEFWEGLREALLQSEMPATPPPVHHPTSPPKSQNATITKIAASYKSATGHKIAAGDPSLISWPAQHPSPNSTKT